MSAGCLPGLSLSAGTASGGQLGLPGSVLDGPDSSSRLQVRRAGGLGGCRQLGWRWPAAEPECWVRAGGRTRAAAAAGERLPVRPSRRRTATVHPQRTSDRVRSLARSPLSVWPRRASSSLARRLLMASAVSAHAQPPSATATGQFE